MLTVIPVIILLNLASADTSPKDTLPTVGVSSNENLYSLGSVFMGKSKPGAEKRFVFIMGEFKRIEAEAASLIQNKRYNDAVNKYKEMFRYQPDYAPAYTNMGDARLLQGKTNEAIALYKKAQEHLEDAPATNGRSLAPLTRFGDMAASNGDYKKAVSFYRPIIYRDTEQDWTLPNGKSIKEQVFPEGIPGGLSFSSREMDVLARGALYLSRLGERDEALKVYNFAVKQYQNYESSNSLPPNSNKTLIGTIISSDHRITLSQIVELPDSATTVDQNQFEAACYTIMALTIDNGSWIDNDGILRRKDEKAALIAAQKAVALAPNYAPAQLILGFIYEKNSEREKAKVAFEEASSLDTSTVREIAARRLHQSQK